MGKETEELTGRVDEEYMAGDEKGKSREGGGDLEARVTTRVGRFVWRVNNGKLG